MNTCFAWITGIGIILSSTLIPPTWASDPTMSLRGMSGWQVVVDEQAIPSEHYAAEEFCDLFKSIAGTNLAIGSAPSSKGTIYIGPGRAMRVHPLGFEVGDLGEESLRIRIGRDAIVIAGGRPRGTLYGVYEFYERYLGVRFLTQDHTYFPDGSADAPIPLVDYVYSPPFSFRWSYYGENAKYPAFAARLRNNTVTPDEELGGNTAHSLISHSLAQYVPASVYGKEHPEYFALVDGVHKLEMRGGGPQLCVTHPEVIRIVSEAVDKELTANPGKKNISLSQMDNGEYCHCPNCQSIAEREGTQMGPHMAFVNAVAEYNEAKHPGVMFGTLAYDYTRKPPKTIHARKNVEIQLCSIECCTLHAINDKTCPQNRDFYEDLAAWRERCEHIWLWHYNTNFRCYDLPFPNLRAIAKNVQFFADNHVHGVFMQAAGNDISAELSDLRNYVMSRCLWHPTLEGWPLVEEFCRLHYRESAEPILEYLQFLHDNAERRGVHPGCFPTEGEVGLDAGVARRISDYFEESLRLAKSDEVRARVEKASMSSLKALLTTTPLVLMSPKTAKTNSWGFSAIEGLYKIDDSALGADTTDRYMELNKRFGALFVAEDTPVDEYHTELARLRKGTPGVVLENQVWRVVILPEENGKIVRMTYKKTGRDLTEAPTRSFTRWHSHVEWTQTGRPVGFAPDSFNWESDGTKVKMSRTEPDGSVMVRTVSLASATSETIDFRTEFTAGSEKLGLEFYIHPEYTTVAASVDPKIVAVYVKDKEWVHANKDWSWEGERLPDAPVPSASGGAYAYYNHGEQFGVVQTFDPQEIVKQKVFWNPGRRQLNLEMFTPMRTLNKGDRVTFGYQVGYLEEPPGNRGANIQR